MRRRAFESEAGLPTLGSTAEAHLLLHVWCKDCLHQVDLDPGEPAERYGAAMVLLDWGRRLRCSQCGSRQVNSIVAPRATGGMR
jgi:hypothetical protein